VKGDWGIGKRIVSLYLFQPSSEKKAGLVCKNRQRTHLRSRHERGRDPEDLGRERIGNALEDKSVGIVDT